MMPACSHTGTPIHFHSSTTSGTADLMRPRIFASVSPRQSPSTLMRASMSFDGDSVPAGGFFAVAFALLLFFLTAVMWPHSLARLDHLPAVTGRIAETRIDRAEAIDGLLREFDAFRAQLLVRGATVCDGEHERRHRALGDE